MNSQKNTESENKNLRIGTRGSDLALWQARHIQGLLEAQGVASECRVIKTQGDRIDHLPLSQLEGKGFFTKELEEALLAERVDLAVHSMKDLSTEMPAGLCLAALVGREDPSELLLARPETIDSGLQADGALLPLKTGARVGTSAARRQAQLLALRPDLEILDLRGNVPTRVKKLQTAAYDAILLARAGVHRLGLDLGALFVKRLPVDGFVPAPAQGMLAIQCREQGPVSALLAPLHCQAAARAVEAERHLLARLEGGCRLPFGVHIQEQENIFKLVAFWKGSETKPVKFTLENDDPLVMADEAFQLIRSQA